MLRYLVVVAIAAVVAAQQPRDSDVDPVRGELAAHQWFGVTEHALVAEEGVDLVSRRFEFTNPRSTEVEWRYLQGSCSCAKAVVTIGERTFELRAKTEGKPQRLVEVLASGEAKDARSIAIGAGASGSLELHVDLKRAKGILTVHFDIHTTDPKAPMMRLNLRASATRAVTVEPDRTDFGELTIGDERPFRAMIMALDKRFAITTNRPFPRGVTASYKHIDKGARFYWLVEGSYRAIEPGNRNATLELITNSNDLPVVKINLHALVRPAVTAKPPFFALGRIPIGVGGSVKVAFSARDGSALEVRSLRLANTNIDERFVSLRSANQDGSAIVELQVAPDAPKGAVRGEVIVDLDHSSMKQRVITFSGLVR